jgi:hypothetical protein
VSEYGFGGYGFDEYVRANIGNTVDALIDYWHDKVSAILRFERANPATAHRVTYESLVLNPARTVSDLCEFLQLPWHPDLLSAVFSSRHVLGPGDAKILRDTAIVPRVGRGASIAVERISVDRLGEMNQLMRELGYDGPSTTHTASLS